ncbi:glycosyltransferase family 39 protein [uncultured Paludibaculum sp.]|uniref:ArnT family glycosyltransferase n=1 Tax=uncultured Paludibaculum sp. TaxID=1765020 RepID=UPI002AAA6D67|nr:glycosyltransferase family 39 protein [uncultured Paludibaculum sp.]
MLNRLLHGRAAWLACVFTLVALQFARQFTAAVQETQVFDEGLHLAAGYSILLTGDYRVNPEHPPLGRILSALPLLVLKPELKLDTEAWRYGDAVAMGRQLLYHQRNLTPEQILLPSRLVTIAMTMILALTMAFWVKARYGPLAGLLAVFLLTLDPSLSAHGHYITTDFIATLTFFLAVIAFDRMVRRGRPIDILWAGLALGIALVSKLSAIFLLPVFTILWVLNRTRWRAVARQAAGLIVLSAIVVAVAYGPETVRSLHARRLNEVVTKETAMGYALRVGGRYLHLPAHQFFLGLNEMALHQKSGHPSYMLGTIRQHGEWPYFPFVFLVKTPLGALLLIVLALPLLWRFNRDLWILAIPLCIYWALCLQSGINIGIRHLLPVYPFTYALVAVLVARHAGAFYRKAAPALVGLACVLVAVESARIAPHDIAFFNLAAGGPANGPKLLVDSNLDWGQDLGNLRRWLDARGTNDVCLNYFGSAEESYYRFQGWAILANENLRTGERPRCHLAAISATLLEGVYQKREWYAWLRARKPVAILGWSIYVYDITDVKEGKVPPGSF